MPALTIVLILFIGLGVFSQFGTRLSAKYSTLWFAVMSVLLVAAAAPEYLQNIAHVLGFKLVSNFILSSLSLITFFELLLQSLSHTRTSRRIRDALCREAAERFLDGKKLLDENNLSTLIVSPCFNEEGELPRTITRLKSLVSCEDQMNFCIVNDGSRDRTQKILKELAPNNHTRHLSNLGVSAALLTGFYVAKDAGYRWVVQVDSDGQHPIEEIPRLIKTADCEGIDLLIGSRFAEKYDRKGSLASTTWQRWLGGRLLSTTLRLFGKQAKAFDPTSGFRVYSVNAVEVLLRQMPDEYPEPESIAIIGAAKLKIKECHVSMQPRQTGVSSLSGGLKSFKFMFKVSVSLLGLRLRLLFSQFKIS